MRLATQTSLSICKWKIEIFLFFLSANVGQLSGFQDSWIEELEAKPSMIVPLPGKNRISVSQRSDIPFFPAAKQQSQHSDFGPSVPIFSPTSPSIASTKTAQIDHRVGTKGQEKEIYVAKKEDWIQSSKSPEEPVSILFKNKRVSGLIPQKNLFSDPLPAVQALAPGGRLLIAKGLYQTNSTIEIYKTIQLVGEDQEIVKISGQDSHRVFDVGGTDVTVSIEEVSILNGSAWDDGPYDGFGGGIRNRAATLKLQRVNLKGNHCSMGGGAIGSLFEGSHTILTDCQVTENLSGRFGGGLFSLCSAMKISGTTVAKNQSQSGGGIFCSEGMLSSDTSVFFDNQASEGGGGISGNGSVLKISIERCLFHQNKANSGGGIANPQGSVLSIGNCTFSRNQANSNGGMGGAVLNHGKTTLLNATITQNRAFIGGGVVNKGQLKIANSIVAGNRAAGSGLDLAGEFLSEGPNLVGDPKGSSGFRDDQDVSLKAANLSVDSIIQNELHFDDQMMGFHLPVKKSLAIDRGSNLHLPPDHLDLDNNNDFIEPIPFDQRGGQRVINQVVDLGAIEFSQKPVVK